MFGYLVGKFDGCVVVVWKFECGLVFEVLYAAFRLENLTGFVPTTEKSAV